MATASATIKWNHTTRVLFCLAFFNRADDLGIYPASLFTSSRLLFTVEEYFIISIFHNLLISLPVYGHLRGFLGCVGTIMSKFAVNNNLQVFYEHIF